MQQKISSKIFIRHFPDHYLRGSKHSFVDMGIALGKDGKLKIRMKKFASGLFRYFREDLGPSMPLPVGNWLFEANESV